MKPLKELNLPYPKALKAAERAMVDGEQAYDDFLGRIEKYKARVEELTTEKAQLHQVGVEQTAQGLMDDEAASRRHYERASFVEHELARYQAALTKIDTGSGKEEAHSPFHTAMQDTRQQWELYWQSIQLAAADHIIETVGVYLTEATDAHALSVSGRIEDWLLDVLLPRITAMEDQKKSFDYPVDRQPPMTPRQRVSEADALARTEESEAKIAANQERKQELWEENRDRLRHGAGPNKPTERKKLLGW